MGMLTNFTFSASKVRKTLTLLVIVLVALNFVSIFLNQVLGHDFVYGLVPLFDLDKESNIPTYFSSILLLMTAGLLFVISAAKKTIKDIYAGHWRYLSYIFLYLSMDEAASIHELFIEPLRKTFGFSGIFYYSWVIIGIASVIILTVIYLRFILGLPWATRYNIILASCVYVGGAIGFELLGGYFSSHFGNDNFTYAMIATIEETLEMTGVIIFINALIGYIILNQLSIQIQMNE